MAHRRSGCYKEPNPEVFWADGRSTSSRLGRDGSSVARMAFNAGTPAIVRASIPRPWVDTKSRSTLGLQSLHHRSIGVQNRGIYCLGSPGV